MNNNDIIARVAEILEKILQMPSHEWQKAVKKLCAGDSGLEQQVLVALRQSASESTDPAIHGRILDSYVEVQLQQNGYRDVRFIGLGGNGRVFAATESSLGRNVAIKILTNTITSFGGLHTQTWPVLQEKMRLVREEAALLARLRHDNIVTLFKVEEMPGPVDGDSTPYFVMELVVGAEGRVVNILEYSRRHCRSIREIIALFLPVCGAVAYAHKCNVVHGDIKPGNILLDVNGVPRMVDLGLARLISGVLLLEEGQLAGTLGYRPLTQDPATSIDVFGLGVVLYEMLCGHHPWEVAEGEGYKGRLLEQMAQHKAMDPRLWRPELPKDVCVPLQNILSRDHNERPAAALALADELRRYQEKKPLACYRTHCKERGLLRGFILERGYQIRKYVTKYPITSLGMLIVMVALWLLRLQLSRAQEHATTLKPLADRQTVKLFTDESDALWPARDAILGSLQDLHRRVRTFVEDETTASFYEQQITMLQSEEGPAYDALIQQRDAMYSLYPILRALETRIETARTIAQITVMSIQDKWGAAAAAIAASPIYDGFHLTPQVGLVPLAPDCNGVWQFWHVESGEEPGIDSRGEAVFTEQTGIVFCLIPGGIFPMGAQNADPGGVNYDPDMKPWEAKVHDVELDAFLIAKCELSQGQWVRMGGYNNSVLAAGTVEVHVNETATLLHPIEMVSWQEFRDILRRYGLEMPTEAQWEYSARGGTTTARWFEDNIANCGDYCNTNDKTAIPMDWDGADLSINDGYAMHAPVNQFPRNNFGLYNVLGNVWELCADAGAYSLPTDPGSGRRKFSATNEEKMARGGSFRFAAHLARSSVRTAMGLDERRHDLGVRPVFTLSTH